VTQSPVSVVTVTYNNARGVAQTLASLAALRHPPLEVVIVDGGSTDDTAQVVDSYRRQLDIRFHSERDEGIYDAMNKGRARARGTLVHYLNGGDSVFGEPYAHAREPSLFDVSLQREDGTVLFDDFVKHQGYGYCHQGILFPREHRDYDTRYRIAADFDAIVRTFPHGLHGLPRIKDAGVRFALGGISSTAKAQRDVEMNDIIARAVPAAKAWRLRLAFGLRNLLPQRVRHAIGHLRQGLSRP
jgi:glycosyltransferase involved in cell wall biosynthesis